MDKARLVRLFMASQLWEGILMVTRTREERVTPLLEANTTTVDQIP